MQDFQYVDIHTHVNTAVFKDDWKEVTDCALAAGVAHINVGTQRDTAKRAVEIAEMYETGVYAIIGLHPIHTSKVFHDPKELGTDPGVDAKGFTSRSEEFDHDFYRELALHEKVVGIGECGLDYYRLSERRVSAGVEDVGTHMAEQKKVESEAQYRLEQDTVARQKEAFIAQIELANEVRKPLMLHVRPGKEGDAYRDALEIIKAQAKVRGNVHFFAGSKEIAQEFFDIGYTISFTGVITFTHDYDEVVAYAPFDMIHAETDAPYVTPVPHRGTRNEPRYVQEVVKRIAEIKKTDIETIRVQLRENARTLFGV